jgi:hypothetical protein
VIATIGVDSVANAVTLCSTGDERSPAVVPTVIDRVKS